MLQHTVYSLLKVQYKVIFLQSIHCIALHFGLKCSKCKAKCRKIETPIKNQNLFSHLQLCDVETETKADLVVMSCYKNKGLLQHTFSTCVYCMLLRFQRNYLKRKRMQKTHVENACRNSSLR